MASDPIVTTGVSGASHADGPVPIRQEIRSLEKNFPDLWTLYVLGLKVFQEADENDLLSYYRISGIHGRPYTPWNDVDGAGTGESGYCTHASILFPTWHRPYLALFEEVLYKIVQKKATEYPESQGRARYVAAAKDFRMPYWDWAAVLPAGTKVFPTSLSSKTLNLVTPTSGGKPTPVDNPLYSFKFHPVNPTPGDFPEAPLDSWDQTVRWPRNNTTVSQNEKISQAIELLNQDSSSNLREKVFGLLASYTRYGPFSNKQWNQGNPGQYGSLEDVHDTIHVEVGGSGSTRNSTPGHMQMVPYAAFDPAFWLHHTNVDRLFAIWQAINPNSYVTPQEVVQETVTNQVGTLETKTTALTPFWENSNAFWTSDGVRKTGTLGYAYPETQSWKFSTPDQYKANVRATIRKLYGGSSLASILADSTPGNLSNSAKLIVPSKASAQPAASKENVQPAKKSPAELLQPTSSKALKEPASVQQLKGSDQKPLRQAKPQHEEPKAEPKHESNPKHRDLTDLTTNGKYLEWIVNLRVEKHTLGGTFSVHIFLGEFERDDASAWRTTENKVGSFNVLGDGQNTGCDKCKSDRERQLVVTGQVPLTLALAERYLAGDLANLKPESVIPYLQTHLHWRITFSDGSEVPRGEVPSLTVSVISNEVTVPSRHDELPHFADDVTVHPEATTARNGDPRGEGTGLTHEGQT